MSMFYLTIFIEQAMSHVLLSFFNRTSSLTYDPNPSVIHPKEVTGNPADHRGNDLVSKRRNIGQKISTKLTFIVIVVNIYEMHMVSKII